MKKFKIIFCIVLVAAVAVGALGVRFGSNRLNATFEVVRNSDFFEKIYIDEAMFDELASGFGMTWNEYMTKFIHNYDSCYGQRIKMCVTNENDFDITVLGLQIKEGNGTNGVYLSETPEKVINVPAGCTEPMSVWFSIMTEGAANDESLSTVRDDMSLKIIYAKASDNIESLESAPEDALIYEWIR